MSTWTNIRNFAVPIAAAAGGTLLGSPALGMAAGSALAGYYAQKETDRANWRKQLYLSEKQHEYDKEMLRLNQEYASPVHQAALLREAGYNPYVAGSEGMLSAPSSSMGSASGVPTPVVSQNPLSAPNQFGDLFSEFASGIEKLSKSDLNEQQKNDLVQTAIDRYKETHENAEKAQFEREIAGVNAKVANDFGYKMADKEFGQLQKTIDKLTSEIANIDQDTANKEEEWYKIYYDALNKEYAYLDNEKMYNAKKALQFWQKTVKNMIEKQFAEIKETYSRANLNNTNSEDLRATRAARIRNLNADSHQKESLARLNDYEFDSNPSVAVKQLENYWDIVVKMNMDGYSMDAIEEEITYVKEQIKLAKKTNDFFAVSQLLSQLRDFTVAVGSVAIARKNFNTGGKPQSPTRIKGFGE